MAPERLTLMAVHAHPDDEVFGTGGVFARAADEGMRTVLVCATGGEEGEIRDPGRDTPEQRARLAEIRAEELRRSAGILGIEEVHFLGYRDSGMLGTPANDHPDNFLHADRKEATRRVVRLIREVQPDVLVTYDERGGYGHPDHVTAHQVTTAAVEAAADLERYPELGLPVWSVPKFYNSANPRSIWQWIGEQMRERGIAPEPEESDYDYASFLTPDEVITTRVDVTSYVPRKHAALMEHQTQISQDEWLHSMPEDLMEALLRTESFIRVRSAVPVANPENDLFAGLRQYSGRITAIVTAAKPSRVQRSPVSPLWTVRPAAARTGSKGCCSAPARWYAHPDTTHLRWSRQMRRETMPSRKQRRRIEIREDIYQALSDLAAREGYSTSRFADKLLALAMEEYAQARQNGRHPFGHTLLNLAKALLRQGDTTAP